MGGANARLFILDDAFYDLNFFVSVPVAIFSWSSLHLLHLLMIVLLASASFAKESAAIFPPPTFHFASLFCCPELFPNAGR